ncbi:MAG: hypothetical protein NT010_06120 [Proteobacteria bacterium]|nr:hypothetical protein [Pseudomonadota bacterium]
MKTEDKEGWTNWTSKKEDLLAELLHKMSIRMGYNFDKVHIKRGHYYPKGYVDIETEQRIIRQGLANIFQNKAFFPIYAIIAPDVQRDFTGKDEDGKAIAETLPSEQSAEKENGKKGSQIL